MGSPVQFAYDMPTMQTGQASQARTDAMERRQSPGPLLTEVLAELPAFASQTAGAASKAGRRPAPDKGTTEIEAWEGCSGSFATASAGRSQEARNPMLRLRFPFIKRAISSRFCRRPAPVFAKIGFAVCIRYGTIWEKVGRLPCEARLGEGDEKSALQSTYRRAHRRADRRCIMPRGRPCRVLPWAEYFGSVSGPRQRNWGNAANRRRTFLFPILEKRCAQRSSSKL